MIANGIKITWWRTDEFIELDPDTLSEQVSIETTLEWHRADKEFFTFNPRGQIRALGGDQFEVILRYDRRDHPKLRGRDLVWGTSTINVAKGTSSGRATWVGSNTSNYDGLAAWERINSGLLKVHKRSSVTKLQRDQDRFKKALLERESRCAISGEETISALEAAHVIAAHKGGAEVIQNGMLLRSDIHRLYDAGKFRINPSGRVVSVSKDLSKAYRELLEGKELPKVTSKRIAGALRYVATDASSKVKKIGEQ
jgi:hypothetical protein